MSLGGVDIVSQDTQVRPKSQGAEFEVTRPLAVDMRGERQTRKAWPLRKAHKYLMYVPGARRFGSAFSLVSTCTGDVMLA